MRLANKTAIVTGAASGIGLGTVRRFLEEGCSVVAVDRDSDRLAAEFADQLDVALCPGDISLSETADRAVSQAIETYGQLDVVFNNAGIMSSGDFLDFGIEAWDQLLNINLRGIMLMCRAAIPKLLQRETASIINTASVMATLTEPGYEAYTTAKSGILGLTKALGVSYAETGVRVNAICPGWIDTPMNTQLAEEKGGMEHLISIIKQQQPNGRMITTREVANVVVFLASDESTGMTGSAVYVDGGSTAAI